MYMKVRLKSSKADQETLMEYEQMYFLFRHNLSHGPHTSINVAVHGSNW